MNADLHAHRMIFKEICWTLGVNILFMNTIVLNFDKYNLAVFVQHGLLEFGHVFPLSNSNLNLPTVV